MGKEFLQDLRVLYHLAFSARRSGSHAEQLEAFYQSQASLYDSFRNRLLPGRRELYSRLSELSPSGIWIDLGGGTGANLDALADRIHRYEKIYLVDLSPSLLNVAHDRIAKNHWHNVEIVHGDASKFEPFVGKASVVTVSYALTMIPDWVQTVKQAQKLLKPEGYFGAVDFYVAESHSFVTRKFWPAWFAWDGVKLNPHHLAYLKASFSLKEKIESRHHLPYVPLGKVPYYWFIGQK